MVKKGIKCNQMLDIYLLLYLLNFINISFFAFCFIFILLMIYIDLRFKKKKKECDFANGFSHIASSYH